MHEALKYRCTHLVTPATDLSNLETIRPTEGGAKQSTPPVLGVVGHPLLEALDAQIATELLAVSIILILPQQK